MTIDMTIDEYVIDDYITLRLEEDETVIYVSGKRFSICKSVLIVNPYDNVYKDINSIDELVDLSPNIEEIDLKFLGVSKEVEFFGHCSNLQLWSENNYDTRLLHSNICFPLLNELCKQGSIKALSMYKKEITKRINSMYIPTIWYLIKNGYLEVFTSQEINVLLDEFKEKDLPLFRIFKLLLIIENYIDSTKSETDKLKKKIYYEIELGKLDKHMLVDTIIKKICQLIR